MEKTVIRCEELADGTIPEVAGFFLAEYDENTGESRWTPQAKLAIHFDSKEAAFTLWKSVHKQQPVRPWDGKPNRPLTAFTVTMEPYEEEG